MSIEQKANTSQNTDSSHLQAIPAYKRGRSNKPPAVQMAVAAKRANGDSISKIASDLNLSRSTVYKVIESTDLDKTIELDRAMSANLIRPAIQVMHDRLKKGSENAAIHVLENTIWPLQSKTSKPPDTALTLAIQNLMGNVQVNAQVTENKAPASSTGTIALPDKSAMSLQVVENKESAG